jgi:60 kDa SS-A/Ro ribonucleoprotein
VAGVSGLTPRDASAALALVTAATEPSYETVGFFGGEGGFKAGPSRRQGWGQDGLTPLPLLP